MLEREVKLAFDTPEQARAAVVAAGASPLRPRRLQHDTLFDSPDGALGQRRCALRLRDDGGRSLVTFKGPPLGMDPAASELAGPEALQNAPAGPKGPAYVMKLREEHETAVEDGAALVRVLEGLGLTPSFRYQKYREEFTAPGVIIAIDETPVGTFIEIEGTAAGIVATARALGRSPDDFILDSYRGLFLSRRGRFGIDAPDMVFASR